ncbi:RHOMBOID-like protein 10, chloroplastic [Rhodamnia argentea]|uniref:RHOMBOID-like protein 10, chloroplastic n=1 Tax=Rhodamnia argentea TaxID=178133 RepID=A0A8B8PFB8_9MYRT|nr:RHOMBOID-like protein 10, chloroplastic [Rhodamnia argentea]
MESIAERAGRATDYAPSKMPGSSANPTPPCYHQHCPFRRLRKLIAGGSSGPTAVHPIADAASLCLGHFLFVLLSVPAAKQRLKDIWCERVLSCNGIVFLRLSRDAFSSTWSSSFHFSDGREGRTDGRPSPEASRRGPSYARRMTDVVLDINTLVYFGQVAMRWQLLSWGAKVNHLINKGKWWRLATSNFLHVNIAHLLLSSLSLDAIGHKVEAVAGPENFLTVYATSAIASQAMSYRLSKAFSVGASGPVCGLVGYLAVYFLRHGGPTGDADKVLSFIATMIIFNMVVGLSAKRIDIWGQVGGFLGGAATSWLLDPFGKLEYRSSDGWKIATDIKGREKSRGSGT